MPFSEWDRGPWNRWSFQHVREIVPTALVSRGEGAASALDEAPTDFGDLTFGLDEETLSVRRWLEESYTDGFLVIRDGTIVTEAYFNGMGPTSLHLIQSVSKSVTAAAAGALVEDGRLDPDKLVTDYLPELETCAYAGARVRHVLDMTSGTYFDETYTTPDSHCAFLDAAAGWKHRADESWPRTVFDLVQRLDVRDVPHGAAFRYRSIETDVLAHCMERAAGMPVYELVARNVWSPMGAERDADFTVDPSGYASADGGLSASLRDLGRFGLMLARRGKVDGRQVIPTAWVDDCLRADPSLFGGDYRVVLPKGAYRNQFWLEEAGKPILICRGVFGQIVYIDIEQSFVAVKLSTWPDFTNANATRTTLAAMRAIRDAG